MPINRQQPFPFDWNLVMGAALVANFNLAPLILNETVAHPLKGFKKEILQHLLFRVELFIARRTIVDLYHRLIQSYRGKASTTASAEEKSETPASLSFCTSRGDIIFYIHATRRCLTRNISWKLCKLFAMSYCFDDKNYHLFIGTRARENRGILWNINFHERKLELIILIDIT